MLVGFENSAALLVLVGFGQFLCYAPTTAGGGGGDAIVRATHSTQRVHNA